MPSDAKIVVVGSHAPGIFVRVKRVPKAGETVIGWDFHEPVDGGKGSNQAIAAARLGVKTSFIGCVGRDRIGEEGERWMQGAGVDTSYLIKHKTVSSGVGFILLAEDGIPAMVTSMGANSELNKEDIEKAMQNMPAAQVMLTQFEMPIEIAMFAADMAKRLGIISIVNPGPAPEEPVPNLDAASILIPNETEAQVLLGREPGQEYDAQEMAKALKQKSKVECVIITLGAKGAVGMDDDGLWQLDVPEVDVVDTSGAGDVFCSALAVGIVNGKTIRKASDWAVKVASLSVTKQGTVPAFPTLEEVNRFIN